MDSIQTVIHDYEEVEFYVSLDYHIGDTELYTCEGWGELYTELGIYDNQPTILDGDSDLDEDGLPDHHLWNSFAGETYSAYAFIDHHMVIRYLSYMPDFDLFTLELIPDLVSAMYGCMDSEADNFDASSVYDDGTCTYLGMSDSFVSLPAQAELLAAGDTPGEHEKADQCHPVSDRHLGSAGYGLMARDDGTAAPQDRCGGKEKRTHGSLSCV